MKRNATRTSTVVLALFLTQFLGLPSTLAAQEKLEQIVRRTGGNVYLLVNRQISPADMSDLVAQADFIVRVLVLEGHSRLTSDEQEIETNYTVQILEVYGESQSTSSGQKIVVTKPGASIRLLGHSV